MDKPRKHRHLMEFLRGFCETACADLLDEYRATDFAETRLIGEELARTFCRKEIIRRLVADRPEVAEAIRFFMDE